MIFDGLEVVPVDGSGVVDGKFGPLGLLFLAVDMDSDPVELGLLQSL